MGWSKRMSLPLYAGVMLVMTMGCLPKPQTIEEAQLITPASRRTATTQYWKQENPDRLTLSPGQRVAITEFSVEFVTVRSTGPFVSQPALKFPPIMPLDAAFDLIGFSRSQTILTPQQEQAVVAAIYSSFVDELARRKITVISPEKIFATPVYRKLTGTEKESTSWALYFNPIGSDTGVIHHSHTIPGTARGVVGASSEEIRNNERQIIHDVGADLAISARFRVGTSRDHAALEQDSIIRLTSPNGFVLTRALHPILSTSEVVTKGKWEFINGRMETINQPAFLIALQTLTPVFLDLAFPAEIESPIANPTLAQTNKLSPEAIDSPANENHDPSFISSH